MSQQHSIQAGKVVALKYTLRDEGGAWIDGSEDGDPLHYLHGADNIVPSVEAALVRAGELAASLSGPKLPAPGGPQTRAE